MIYCCCLRGALGNAYRNRYRRAPEQAVESSAGAGADPGPSPRGCIPRLRAVAGRRLLPREHLLHVWGLGPFQTMQSILLWQSASLDVHKLAFMSNRFLGVRVLDATLSAGHHPLPALGPHTSQGLFLPLQALLPSYHS